MDGPRPVRPEEIEDLTDLLDAIFGFDYYKREYMIAGLRRPVMETGRVIAEGGKPISYIFSHDAELSMYGCTVRVASIGCVGTREDRRKKGYAGAILTHHIERMEAAGVRLMIVSGDRNLYRRNHCVHAGVAYEAKLTPGLFAAPPTGLSVRRAGIEEWSLLAPLYQAEAAHFVRPADLEGNLCFWWDCCKFEIYAIEHGGRPVAYAVLGGYRWRDERGHWTAEYAGSRAALLEAMPRLFEATGSSLISVQALAQDVELRYRLAEMGVGTEWRTISGTKRLINLPGLMEDLRDYLAAQLTERDLAGLSFAQEGERCTFALGRERLDLDLSEACRLVCGHPNARTAEGALGRALGAIFPLPTIQAGLNYV